MKKISLPKNHLKGLKIYCNKCKRYNPRCRHIEELLYRLVVHIPGSKNSVKSKSLLSRNYEDAVKESMDIIKELKSNDYRDLSTDNDSKEYTMIGAILKYNQYLSGEYELKHLIKKVSEGHRKESLRFIKLFFNGTAAKFGISGSGSAELNIPILPANDIEALKATELAS